MPLTATRTPDLIARYHADGYEPGAPAHITPRTLSIDTRNARLCKCARCKHRGLACVPMHKGPRYRVVAVCPTCNHSEER